MTDQDPRSLDEQATAALAKLAHGDGAAASALAVGKAIVKEIVPQNEHPPNMVAEIARGVAAELRKQDMGAALAAEIEKRHQSEMAQLASMALTVLDSCGISLKGSCVEMHDGTVTADMLTVTALKALKVKARDVGVDETALKLQVDGAYREHEAGLVDLDEDDRAAIRAGGDHNITDEDEDRKGIFDS